MKRQIVLVLALCLAIASPSLAAFSIGCDPAVDVGDGLSSYQVYLTDTSETGGLASAFDSVSVSGQAVQFSMGAATSGTVLDTDIINNPGADQSYLAKDTHLITPAAGWVSIVGGASETNDASISTVATGPWSAPHILGLGAMTSTSADAYGFETQAGDVYFLQVVLQSAEYYLSETDDNSVGQVTLQIFGADMEGNPAGPLYINAVPEPSTIVMLLIGGLSLLWFRRK
jgi:PEP-CTERM motif